MEGQEPEFASSARPSSRCCAPSWQAGHYITVGHWESRCHDLEREAENYSKAHRHRNLFGHQRVPFNIEVIPVCPIFFLDPSYH